VCSLFVETSEEFKNKMRALAAELKIHPDSYIEELRIDTAAGIAHRTIHIKGQKKREGETTLGKEQDGVTHDNRPAKVIH